MLLEVIIATTRPGRLGHAVGKWAFEAAQKHAGFEVELVDLLDVALPIFDEPKHPRLRQYEHDHTKGWSATIDRADAFVLVTPEYNTMPPPSLVNAMDYLYLEWNYKPVAFVSYGGISGGVRAVQVMKMQTTTLNMAPIFEAVSIPFFHKQIEAGVFKA